MRIVDTQLTHAQAERLAELLSRVGLRTSDTTHGLLVRLDRVLIGTTMPDARDTELSAACAALDDRDLLDLRELTAAASGAAVSWCRLAAKDEQLLSYCHHRDFAEWDPPHRDELLEMRARVLLRTEVDAGVPNHNCRVDKTRITDADRARLRAIGDELRWTGSVPRRNT